MTNEEKYDAIVSPILRAAVEKCKELGFSMVARVEFEGEDAAVVRTPENKSAGQRLAHYAALSYGDIDSLCLAILREGDGHNSIFLARHAKKKETPCPPTP